MSLTETGIEYLDFHWGFYPGCNHWKTGICPVGEDCWAKRRAENPYFGGKKGNFEPHLISGKLLDPLRKKKPSRIGVCITGDLGGEWVDPNEQIGIHRAYEIWASKRDSSWINFDTTLRDIVFEVCRRSPHIFVFLTKNPSAWLKWVEWPNNCWVGATVCNVEMFHKAVHALAFLHARHKWLSIEPLMSPLGIDKRILPGLLKSSGIDWLVIGGWDKGKVHSEPEIKWVQEIIEATDQAGIPVFLKNNLRPLITMAMADDSSKDFLFFRKDGNGITHLRQEFPQEMRK